MALILTQFPCHGVTEYFQIDELLDQGLAGNFWRPPRAQCVELTVRPEPVEKQQIVIMAHVSINLGMAKKLLPGLPEARTPAAG